MNGRVIYSASSSLSVEEKIKGILSTMGGLSKFVRPGNRVLIKPNFVAPFPHATTSLEVLEVVLKSVRDCGGKPVIAESSGYEFDTEATFKILGVRDFAKRTRTELINLDTSEFERVRIHKGIFGEVWIPKLVRKVDVLINVPKLKRHSLTEVTVGIKNLFGLLHRKSRRIIHSLGLERGVFELSRVVRCDLVIVDGTTVSERAVYSDWQKMDCIVGGTDIYAVDIHCCQFLGVNYKEVGHIRLALENGIANENYRVVPVCQEGLETGNQSPMPAVHHSIKTRLRKAGYRAMYLAEIPYTWITEGKSLVPSAHYYFGIRPKLDPNKCTQCGECEKVCPVGAIQVPLKRIDASVCMLVRCLKCIDVCPESAISTRGYGAPDDLSSIISGKQTISREDT